MKINRLLIIFILLFFFPFVGLTQQSIIYTQFPYIGIVYNPSYAGVDDEINISAIYRYHWLTFNGTPRTFHLIANASLLDRGQIGLGFQYYNDMNDIIRKDAIVTSYAYKILLKKDNTINLRIGLQTSIANDQTYFSKLNIITSKGVQDPLFNSSDSTVINFNVGVGLYLKIKKFVIAFSSPYLLKHQLIQNELAINSLNNQPYFLATGIDIGLNEGIKLKLNALGRSENEMYFFDSNLILEFNKIVYVGSNYRFSNDFGLLTGIRINSVFELGYSYDFVDTKLRSYHFGSHELRLSYRISKRNYRLENPRFF